MSGRQSKWNKDEEDEDEELIELGDENEEEEEEEEEEDNDDNDNVEKSHNVMKESTVNDNNSDNNSASGNIAGKGGKKEEDKGEKLPPCKPAVEEITLLLPGQGEEKITVSVRLSVPEAIRVERRKHVGYRNTTDRHGSVDDDEIEEEEEEEEGLGGSGTRRSRRGCPSWLPYLLSDDIFYWERTLLQMYGHEVSPDVRDSLDAHANGVREERPAEAEQDDNEGEEEEEEEHVSGSTKNGEKEPHQGNTHRESDATTNSSGRGFTAPSQRAPYNYNSGDIRSSVNRGDKDHEADHSQLRRQSSVSSPVLTSRLSVASIPLTVLRFTGANTILFLVRAANGRRWYLLDTLQQQVPRGKESDGDSQGTALDKKKGKNARVVEEEGDEEEDTEEGEWDEDEDEEEDDEKSDKSETLANIEVKNQEAHQNEGDGSGGGGVMPSIKDLDMNSVICIDVLMLAALQSSTALRCCLSQRTAASFACIEEWLRMDLRAALPIFTAIHRMMLSVYTTGQMRLPYRLPGAVIDYNIFFTPAYISCNILTYPRLNINIPTPVRKTGPSRDEVILEGEKQGIETMEALLKVQLLPSKLILVKHLSSVVGIRMLLYLLMEIPKSLLLAWGAVSPISEDENSNMNMNRNSTYSDGEDDDRNIQSDGDNTDYDEDEDDNEEIQKRRRGFNDASVATTFLRRNSRETGPRFVPSPFLLAVAVDIRRRLCREKNGSAPSQFTLTECVAHALLKRVEDGHPRRDPLLVSEFSFFPVECVDSAGGALSRPQRLYQSDLVLLLLASTTTMMRREIVVPQKEMQRSVILRPRASMFTQAPDAHHELFQYLLRKKAEKVRTPEAMAQSGYFRLLYLCLLRFKSPSTVQLLLSMSPLFSLFGPLDRCPLDDLLSSWLFDRYMQSSNYYLDLFVETFWNELHYRCSENHFDDTTINKGRTLLLMDKMQDRRKAYTLMLQHICSPSRARTQTCPGRIPFQRNSSSEVATSSALTSPSRVNRMSVMFQPTTICEYDEDFRQMEEQIRLIFESLPMAPRTYLTPETLHAVLFTGHIRNVNVVRYLMLRCRVVTVHTNPLTEPAVPAMEYALRCGDLPAVNILIGIGATLHDYIDSGNLCAEALLTDSFLSKLTIPLLEEWKQKEKQRSSDPSVYHGILRTVASAP